MSMVIIYHSGYGHTKIVAEHIQKGASRELTQVTILTTLEALDNLELLHQADCLVFGSSTVRGKLATSFKPQAASKCLAGQEIEVWQLG